MKKVYLTAAIVAAMSATFVACTNELDVSVETSVAQGQEGRIVFNVNTGKSVSFTRSTAADAAIKKLSVFVFDAGGSSVPGVTRDYEASVITGGKLSVALPADLMNQTGLKAYLVANVTFGEAVFATEADFEAWVTTASTTAVTTDGIPMSSPAIVFNTTATSLQAEAQMKRAMSSLYVKVSAPASEEAPVEGSTPEEGTPSAEITARDFTYRVMELRLDKGYLNKDEVCEGEAAPDALWTPEGDTNEEELLGYMYQSNGFKVMVIPNNPKLGTQPRTVIVNAAKAKQRNRKYVLNVTPTVTEGGEKDFTVTVQDWDASDGSYDVDWMERFAVKATGLPAKVTLGSGKGLVIEHGMIASYATPEALTVDIADCISLAANTTLVKVEPQGAASSFETSANTTSITVPAVGADGTGKLVLTTDNNGVRAAQNLSVTVKNGMVKYLLPFDDKNGTTMKADEHGRIVIEMPKKDLPFEVFSGAVASKVFFKVDSAYEIVGLKLKEDGSVGDVVSCSVTSDPEGKNVVSGVQVSSRTEEEVGSVISIPCNVAGVYYCKLFVELKKKSDNSISTHCVAVKATVTEATSTK